MRPKSLLLLALALGCGLVASIGISQVMQGNSGSPKLDTVPIYVAVHNINLGDPIDAAMLSLQEWPKGKVPRGAISTLEELEGRRPRAAIFEGEPILEAKLLAPGEMADPISSIPKTMRLKTIAVDAEKSAAGLLGPGDRVDVQLFVRKDQRTGIEATMAKIILQNIRVFAVDQTVQRSADGGEERAVAKTVSLMLTPDQATKLTLAERIGELSLIPRNPDDESEVPSGEVGIDEVWGNTEKNDRAKEQGLAEEKPATDPNSSLSNAIQNAMPVKAPFIMEIVEAQAVREVRFDVETGRPIHTSSEPTNAGGPTLNSNPEPTGDGEDPAPADASKMLDDFPIDFNAPK